MVKTDEMSQLSGVSRTVYVCHWGQLPSTEDLVQGGVTLCLANLNLIRMIVR